MDSSSVETDFKTVSTQVPWQAAITTPPPTPKRTATARADRETFSVRGSRLASSWAISRLPM